MPIALIPPRVAPRADNTPAPAAGTPTVSFVSLGCPKALVDSERIITRLRAEGYALSRQHEGADVVVVNTCGFLDSAKAESLSAISDALAENGKVIARAIFEKLAQLRPADRAFFEQRLNDFNGRIDAAEKRWLAMMAPYKGVKVATYHRSFPNFADRFGLDVMGYVEPRPGIPPSPQHTLDLINEMKQQNVKLVLVEPYFDLKTPNAIARDTGAKVLVLSPSVGGSKEASDYIALFDYDITQLVAAIQQTGAR